MKRNKGITLIALIITIIVLLILAGITLNMVMGDSGIFSKANKANEETNKSQATEIMNLKITTAQMNSYAEKQTLPSLQELANILDSDNEIEYVHTSKGEYGSIADIDIGAATSIYTKLKEYPYEFEINSSLQLASIDGVKVATNPAGGSGNYESQLINDFNIKCTINESRNATIDIDGSISTKDNSRVKGYIILVNSKVHSVTGIMPYEITGLSPKTDYIFQAIAIDENIGLKINSNNLTIKTAERERGNLNLTDVVSCTADDYWDGCAPQYAIDGSMATGQYHNWYGGTKMLIEYKNLVDIDSIGAYSTNHWGYSTSSVEIYYSEDDSLTLESDLSGFNHITVKTESVQNLAQIIKAKRIMMVVSSTTAIYEFECYGR